MDILARYEHLPDPISLSIALAPMALQVAGQVMGGIAGAQQGAAQAKVEEYNAKVAEQQAKAIEQKTAFESQRQAEAAEREASATRAKMGAAGVVTTAGTPLLIQAKQASEMELENLMIGYTGATEAQQARSQAAIDRAQGAMAKQKGRAEMYGSFMKAGGTLLTGF